MEKKEIKKCKKTLNILRIAATDKENLTSKFNKKKNSSSSSSNKAKDFNLKRNKKSTENDNNTESVQIKNNINNKPKPEQPKQSLSLLETDLIIDNPSENYWQKLAESRRRAIEITLKENVELHNKVNELEYENSRLKAMLEEAKSLVEVLTEMIEENNDDNGNETDCKATDDAEENFMSGDNKEVTSESDMEEMSFQSCL